MTRIGIFFEFDFVEKKQKQKIFLDTDFMDLHRLKTEKTEEKDFSDADFKDYADYTDFKDGKTEKLFKGVKRPLRGEAVKIQNLSNQYNLRRSF